MRLPSVPKSVISMLVVEAWEHSFPSVDWEKAVPIARGVRILLEARSSSSDSSRVKKLSKVPGLGALEAALFVIVLVFLPRDVFLASLVGG